jgi:hypothetical protein
MLDFSIKLLQDDKFLWSITWYWISILFIILGFLFLLIRKDLISFFKRYISKLDLMLISFLFISWLLIRFYFLDYSHITMNDEYMYIQHSRELIETWNILSPIRSVWWSFLLLFPFSLFWISSYIWFIFSIFLWGLTITIFYILINILFKNKIISFFSSLLFTILPFHVFWSTKMETNLSSLLMIITTILVYIIFQKTKNIKIFYFSIVLTLFSTTFRWENIPVLLLSLFLLTLLNYKKVYFNIKNLVYSFSIFICTFLLVLPNYLNQYHFSTSKDWTYWKWGNFWLDNLYNNFDFFIKWFFNNDLYSYYNCISLLGCIYFVYFFYRNIQKLWINILIFFMPFILLFFSYNFTWLKYVAQENRLYMEIYPLYILFFWFWIYIIYLILNKFKVKYYLIYLSLGFITIYNINNYDLYYKKSDYRKLQTIVSNNFKKDISEKNKGCIYILSQNTYYTAFTDIPYTFTYQFIWNKNLQKDILNAFSCVIYIHDMKSVIDTSLGDIKTIWTIKLDLLLNNTFILNKIKVYSLNNLKYWFYKITRKNEK